MKNTSATERVSPTGNKEEKKRRKYPRQKE